MSNTVKCERCRKQFIDEEFDSHFCTPNTTKAQEIGIDFILKGELNENGDKIHLVKGLNGILYRLVECQHNPPHTNTYPTSFDSFEIRQKYEKNIGYQPKFNRDNDQPSTEQNPFTKNVK